MLKSLFLFFVCLSFQNAYSQVKPTDSLKPNLFDSLQGVWNGYFEDNFMGGRKFPINLYFDLKKDGTYSVYSYSQGVDTIVICSVAYKLAGTDSVYLVEEKVLKPKENEPTCFQNMKLRMRNRNNKITMSGIWNSSENCGRGTILFKRKIK
ncbi:MAG TPA: hypothetical protein VLR49_08435 [Ferruginibacter sp.]|nr:hypothetical protein [Ferruginibacter sp.]